MSKESALASMISTPEVTPAAPETPTPVAAPVVENPNSKAFSHLARKEAELQRERVTFNAEKTKLEEANKQYQEYLATKAKDPIAALKLLGFSETDVFNYMAAQQPVEKTPEEKAIEAATSAADARIKSFEDAQAKRESDQKKEADDQLINSYKSSVAQVVEQDKDKYEYCAYYGDAAQELIYETVLAVVKNSNGADVPTPAEAAQMVEEYYEEKDKSMMTLKKRQPKAPEAEAPKADPARSRTVVEKPKDETAPKPSRTITRNATVTAASARSFNETKDQKRERLISKLRGE